MTLLQLAHSLLCHLYHHPEDARKPAHVCLRIGGGRWRKCGTLTGVEAGGDGVLKGDYTGETVGEGECPIPSSRGGKKRPSG